MISEEIRKAAWPAHCRGRLATAATGVPKRAVYLLATKV